eukprot:365510-Chlamydomonas_euryale.AAC.3
MYAPGRRIPCNDSWAGRVGTLTSRGPRPAGIALRSWVPLRLASFSRLTRVDQDTGESTCCRQAVYVHEAPQICSGAPKGGLRLFSVLPAAPESIIFPYANTHFSSRQHIIWHARNRPRNP